MLNFTRSLRRKTGWFHQKVLELTGAAPVQGVIATIAPGDGMYLGDHGRYFEVGYSALRCLRIALTMAEKDEVGSILDLACGHGRVLRVLKAAFPQARLTACDVNRDGVDFCAKVFGATPVDSSERPEEVTLPGQYDLIWCGSLFTHLDQDRWPGFLDLMQAHSAEGGVLAFTTHGPWVARRLRTGTATYDLGPAQVATILKGYDSRGFGYARQSSPAEGDWGLSVSRPSWVVSQLEGRRGLDMLAYWERGWDRHQDVVLLRSRSRDCEE